MSFTPSSSSPSIPRPTTGDAASRYTAARYAVSRYAATRFTAGRYMTSQYSASESQASGNKVPGDQAPGSPISGHPASTPAGGFWPSGDLVRAETMNGAAAPVTKRGRASFAVGGGRYGFQIDADTASARSEALIIEFATVTTVLDLHITMLANSEWQRSSETGRWTAFGPDGNILATGLFEASAPNQRGAAVVPIQMTGVAQLRIEATPYGHGLGPARPDNQSDFAVVKITIERPATTQALSPPAAATASPAPPSPSS